MSNLEFSERALTRFTEEPRLATERRDTELAVTLWHEKASELGSPPPVEAFDLSRAMDWSYRFIICGAGISDSVFLCTGHTLPACSDRLKSQITTIRSWSSSRRAIDRCLRRAVMRQPLYLQRQN
jgi:hypothetical protein